MNGASKGALTKHCHQFVMEFFGVFVFAASYFDSVRNPIRSIQKSCQVVWAHGRAWLAALALEQIHDRVVFGIRYEPTINLEVISAVDCCTSYDIIIRYVITLTKHQAECPMAEAFIEVAAVVLVGRFLKKRQ